MNKIIMQDAKSDNATCVEENVLLKIKREEYNESREERLKKQGIEIQCFQYKECTQSCYDKFRLKDLHCKHRIAIEPTPLNNEVYLYAETAFSHYGIKNRFNWSGTENKNGVEKHINIIKKMIDSDFMRPMRIIIDTKGRLWADNTHTCIQWIIREGENICLGDVPYYITDFSNKNEPVFLSIKGSGRDSVKDIKSAIACGYRIEKLVNVGYRPTDVNYQISHLCETPLIKNIT